MIAPTSTIGATVTPEQAAPTARDALRWLRRWHRITIPISIAVLLVVVTVIAHARQNVDPADRDFLNPTSSAPIGGLDLAARLRGDGITVDRAASTTEAVNAVNGPSTLFVPAPALVRPDQLAVLLALPVGTRIVLVAPSADVLTTASIPISGVTSRWITRRAAPGCAQPQAAHAGPADVDRLEYGTAHDQSARCYANSLLELTIAGLDVIVVGASDLFRNDHIGEAGNDALATGLLNTRPTLVWLDLHTAEVVPPPPTPTFSVPSDATGPTRFTSPPDTSGAGQNTEGGQSTGGDVTPPPAQAQGRQNTITDLFPAWLWALIGLIGLIGVVLALAGGRRLGPPVTEPIPVAARSNEIVEGRGRLYLRSGDPAAALRALRAAAIDRLRLAAGLTASASAADLVAATATRTGLPPDDINDTLYGPEPTDDQQLVDAVKQLDALTGTTEGAAGPDRRRSFE